MLQEILMAMIGNTGGVLIETNNSYTVNPSLENISKSEKIIIKKICDLGFFYKKIQKFNDLISENLIDQILEESLENLENEKKMEIENSENLENNEKRNFCYRGKISQIFEIELEKYFEKILKIEENFLNGKIINLNNFFVEFSDFYDIFPECIKIIKKLEENITQSEILDFLYEKKINGNNILKNLYLNLFNSVYLDYQKKIKNWIIYGKTSKNFFIKKMSKNSQKSKSEKIKDWDNDFLLQISSIPKNIISIKIANKILFIGKAMKILIKEEGIFSEILNFISKTIKEIKIYEKLNFSKIFEKIRKKVSNQFITLILKKEKIHKDIDTVKNIYLLYNEEFFSTFIEESLEIISLPPNKYAEYEINNKSFQNTILRLNLKNEEIFKNIRFVLKTKGFEYNNFSNLKNLQFIGDFEKSESFLKFLSFKNNFVKNEEINVIPKPSIWNGIKHNIENKFIVDFCIRFKKNEKISKISYIKKNQNNQKEKMSVISLIFQSKYDVNLYKKNKNLYNFYNMNSFLCFNFGFYNKNEIINNEQISFITIFTRYGDNNPQKIFEKKYSLENLNFSDQDIRFIKIRYENNYIKLYISKNKIKKNYSSSKKNSNSKNNFSSNENFSDILIEEFPINISEVIDLDLGRAYLGIMNNSTSEKYNIDLFSFCLDCKNFLLTSQTWNGLVPFFDCQWPNNIILNISLLERFEQIFSLIFPLKICKYKLSLIFKKMKIFSFKKKKKFIFLFQKLRSFLDHFFNSVLDYIYTDVIKKEVDKLFFGFDKIDDFKILRKKINLFSENIYNQIFFNFPDLIKNIFIFVDIVNTFHSYLQRVDNYNEKQNCFFFQKLFKNSEKILIEFLKFLRNLSDTGVNQFYNKLILRLNFNSYFDQELLDIDLD